jgi:hypothetical protein
MLRMDSGAVAYDVDNTKDQTFTIAYTLGESLKSARYASIFGDLSEEARQDLLNYLNQVGLTSESPLLVIPSNRHFFYDKEDVKGVRTIVNLKQLNHIREMREFLNAISGLMANQSSFIGCFVDNKSQNGFSDKYSALPGQVSEKAEAYENGIESRIPFINRMYSFIDSRTNRYLTRKSVKNILAECGLQVIGMTELNGLTYFYSQKSKPAA